MPIPHGQQRAKTEAPATRSSVFASASRGLLQTVRGFCHQVRPRREIAERLVRTDFVVTSDPIRVI